MATEVLLDTAYVPDAKPYHPIVGLFENYQGQEGMYAVLAWAEKGKGYRCALLGNPIDAHNAFVLFTGGRVPEGVEEAS